VSGSPTRGLRWRPRTWAVVLALLAAVAMASCGKQEKQASRERTTISRPYAATNDSSSRAVDRGAARRRGGRVVGGEPSLDELGRLGPAPVGVGDARGGCAGAGLMPSRGNLGQVAAATLCLLNAERGSRGLRSLRANGLLARAARAHAQDMAAHAFFSHASQSGTTAEGRIRRTGYIRGGRSWTVGENIAWGTGQRATPREIVQAWMQSPGHRANILRGAFREIGVGIAVGAPVRSGAAGATYNTDFGALRR
jgi:uncharacterized protein YkwD